MSMRMAKTLFMAMVSMAAGWFRGEKQRPAATPTAGEIAPDLAESDKTIEASVKEELKDGLPGWYWRGASARSIRKGKFFWRFNKFTNRVRIFS